MTVDTEMQNSSRTADRVFGVVIIVLAAALAAAALSFPPSAQDSDPGTAALPWLIAIALAGLGAVLVARAEPNTVAPPREARVTIASIVLLTVVYALVFTTLGFLIATFLYLNAAIRLMGERRLARVVLISAAFSAALYLLFAEMLAVYLPSGLLEGII